TLVGEIETETCEESGTTVTLALADWLESAALIAVTVTVWFDATVVGAVYRPVELTIPVIELPPITPSTNQFTAVFVVPVTVALNCWDCPACKLLVVGEIEIATVGAVTVTTALADFVVSATLVSFTL